MILFEQEAKAMLATKGVQIPDGVLIHAADHFPSLAFPCVLKAQVACGNRAKYGGIITVKNEDEARAGLRTLFAHTIADEPIQAVLVEQYVSHTDEKYLAITYDPERRGPVIMYGDGGTGVENSTPRISTIDIENQLLPKDLPFPNDLLQHLVDLFFDEDLTLLEINPLVETSNGWCALDAKIHLDDAALFRHPERTYSERSPGRPASDREARAHAIDKEDHRGTAGASYVELDGDIAILASGGGASLLALDALYAAGGRPANYVEYSGNPPKEKVEALARIVLSKPDLKGLWIVGAVANFTDIYETLSSIMETIAKIETERGEAFDFPIVIRRGGPRDEEAFTMLRSLNRTNLHLMGLDVSIASSAARITQLSYAQ